MFNINVLFLDDEYNNHVSFKAIFRNKYNIFLALNYNEALDILSKHKIDVFICDERMPDMNGSELLEMISLRYPNVINILTTAYTDISAVTRSVNNGHIRYYIPKPWDEDVIEKAINESYAYSVKSNTTQDIIDEVNDMFLLKDRTRNRLLELKSQINNLSNNEINTILDKIITTII